RLIIDRDGHGGVRRPVHRYRTGGDGRAEINRGGGSEGGTRSRDHNRLSRALVRRSWRQSSARGLGGLRSSGKRDALRTGSGIGHPERTNGGSCNGGRKLYFDDAVLARGQSAVVERAGRAA